MPVDVALSAWPVRTRRQQKPPKQSGDDSDISVFE